MSARVRQVYDCPYDILYRVVTPDHNRRWPHVCRVYIYIYMSIRLPFRVCLSIAKRGRNHNNEWQQFSRYKPRDGTVFPPPLRMRPVKEEMRRRAYT